MKKRIIIAVLSICTILSIGCGSKTVHALEPSEVVETVEETEVMVTESMEATETEEDVSLESIEMQEDITDADYIAMAKDCEKEFKILEGEKYNCDIAIEIRGCTYIYEFPEKDVNAEECNLVFEYSEAEVCDWNTAAKKVGMPVSIEIGSNKYLIGTMEVFGEAAKAPNTHAEIEHLNYYYDCDTVEYRKIIEEDLLKNSADKVSDVIIRSYNPENRMVEFCHVSLVENETSTTYEIEKEEWVTMPLGKDVEIISYSLGGTSTVHISENVFADRVEEYHYDDDVYLFATMLEKDGSITGIIHEYLP